MSSEGSLADKLAEAIFENLNARLKDAGNKDDPFIHYLLGKDNDLDFGKLVESLKIMARQINMNTFRINTILEYNKMDWELKYPDDHEYFRFIVQSLKRIEAQREEDKEKAAKAIDADNADISAAETDENQANKSKTPLQRSVNRIEIKQNKLIHAVGDLKRDNRHIRTDIEDSETRAHKRSIRMERSIKRTIKSRMGKLWSMFKKTLVIGLLLFFSPVLKKAFAKLADWLSPVTEWFKETFPTLYGYISDLSAYVGSIASDFKFLTDKFKAILDWKEENSTLIKGIEGAIAGAGMGALLGTVVPGIGNVAGALLGGLIGFGVGAGSDKLKEVFGDPNPTNKAGKTPTVTELAEGYADEDLKEGKITKAQYDNAVQGYTATIKREREKESTATNIENYEKQRQQANESKDYWLSLTPAERLQLIQRNAKPASATTSASSTETSADVIEDAGFRGTTDVEPSGDGGNNNVTYQVLQQTNNQIYHIHASDTLWSKK